MDLNAVRVVVIAAEAGSLSEAARRSGIPLPTLSRQVRKLEDGLGVRLLDRSPQGLTLTPAGARLVTDAAPALELLAQAEQRLYDESGVSGTLRISLPPHLQPLWELFSAFGRRYPAVTFDLFVTDRRVDLVADGIDIAIRVGESGSSVYVGRTLTRYRHLVVASPSFLNKHAIVTPQDLLSAPCASWRSGGPSVWQLGDSTIRFEPLLVTNDYLHLLHRALSGDVVTELPPFLARRAVREGLLVSILPDYPLPERPMRALVAERRWMPPLVRQFLDYTSEHVVRALEGA